MRLLISLLHFRHSNISSTVTLVNRLEFIGEDKIGMIRGDEAGDDAGLEYCREIRSW